MYLNTFHQKTVFLQMHSRKLGAEAGFVALRLSSLVSLQLFYTLLVLDAVL